MENLNPEQIKFYEDEREVKLYQPRRYGLRYGVWPVVEMPLEEIKKLFSKPEDLKGDGG